MDTHFIESDRDLNWQLALAVFLVTTSFPFTSRNPETFEQPEVPTSFHHPHLHLLRPFCRNNPEEEAFPAPRTHIINRALKCRIVLVKTPQTSGSTSGTVRSFITRAHSSCLLSNQNLALDTRYQTQKVALQHGEREDRYAEQSKTETHTPRTHPVPTTPTQKSSAGSELVNWDNQTPGTRLSNTSDT